MRSTIAQLITLAGAALMLASAVGVIRFPSVFHRMHALSVGGASGIGLIAIGAAVGADEPKAILPLLAVVAFQFMTVPVASHLIGRAAHRSVDRVTTTGIDDLAGVNGHAPRDHHRPSGEE